ncbi:type I restriction enzyme HsdR N-terminal domain-containing protein [Deferribacter autotrophicus]|uniref:Type I restriction enzyme HsdR N-terminal domain-containing protein n=1 Tax=Deferribacter autotrophicus TaxID=500465 RepID=A0A5A8F4N9_9BACT|nr:type I restriction enzyme HsdR N-terminal domain-containing protein [Deferribacter autotrophicus]KAA0257563.1 type I restriction enzyme HsdR N-terminal domain-containing protein [Deferribacter autotrophicus]
MPKDLIESTKTGIKNFETLKEKYKKFVPILKQASEIELNESDTCNLVTKILEELLDYTIFEITTEHRIRNQYADFAIKVDGQILFIIEVKSLKTKLNDNHLTQAATYAANEGVEWVLLTNGIEWKLYHVNFEKPISWELVFDISLLENKHNMLEKLCLLTKYSFLRNEVGKYNERLQALSETVVKKVLLTDDVIKAIVKGLKKETGYNKIEPEKVKKVVKRLLEVKQ